MFLFLLGVVFVVFAFFYTVRIVPQTEHYVIESLGKYKTTWNEGIHFLIPVLERVVCKVSYKEHVADFEPQNVITKDNVMISIDTVVYFTIFDAKIFAYGAVNPVMALENLTATTLRNLIGEKELDETLTSRDEINSKMQVILDEVTDAWGIKVKRVELKNIVPPQEIQDAMEKQMKAEREKRQTLLEAEAHQEAVIRRADGDAKARILNAQAERDAMIAKAEGEAKAIQLVYEAEAEGLRKLKESEMDDSVLRLKALEALEKVGDGRATKIIVPTDLTDVANRLTMTGELLGMPGAEPIDKSPKNEKAYIEDACCTDVARSKVTKELVREYPSIKR